MAILTIGIDLAKNVFAGHGISEAGKPELILPAVARDKLHELIAALRDRHGSLLGRPPLGVPVCRQRPHRAPDRPQVRHALSAVRKGRDIGLTNREAL